MRDRSPNFGPRITSILAATALTVLLPVGLQAQETGSAFWGMPAWLQALLVAVVVLLAYALIAAFISGSRRSREEQIIHRKEASTQDGDAPDRVPSYAPPRPQRSPAPPPRQPGSTFPPPRYPRPQTPPSQDDPQAPKPGARKKSSTWGTVIFVIIIINILRQCLSNN